jgi:hypothetical protein
MAQLYTKLFAARARGAASYQVGAVMKECEARGLEIMEDTSQLSTTAASSVEAELADLGEEIGRRQKASLMASHNEGEVFERALIAPGVRELPKHRLLLAQLAHELESSLQLTLSRPAEWFEILGRSLRLEEGAVKERDERLSAATFSHAAELSAHSSRAAEEVQAEEGVQERREKQLTSEAQATAERIAAERRGLIADRGVTPDVKALVAEAVAARRKEGEEKLLEGKRHASERLDLLPNRKGSHAKSEAGGGSLDARHRTKLGEHLPADTPTPLMEGLLLVALRDHYQHLVAEANTSKTRAEAVVAASGNRLTPEWSEDGAAGGMQGLSVVENDALHHIELEMQTALRESILTEHAAFASAAKELAATREGLRLSAMKPPPSGDSAAAIEFIEAEFATRKDPEVAAAEESVTSLRDKLTASSNALVGTADGAETSVLRAAIEESRGAFSIAFDEQRRESSKLAREQQSARDEALEEGATLRATEIAAHGEAGKRKLLAADEVWAQQLEEVSRAGAARLEPVRKRLASAKRSLASELMGCLRVESEARAQSHVAYSLASRDAREAAEEQQLHALVGTHQAEAGELATLRMSQLDHIHGTGDWAGGFLSQLMSVGAITEMPDLKKGVRRKSVAPSGLGGMATDGGVAAAIAGAADGAVSPTKGFADADAVRVPPLQVSTSISSLQSIGSEAKQVFTSAKSRPEADPVNVRTRLAPRRVRSDKPMHQPPLPPVPVAEVLGAVEADLGEGVPWAAPRLHSAHEIHASLKRVEPPVMPAVEAIEVAEAADAEAAAAAAAAVANEAKAATAAEKLKEDLRRKTMQRVAQKRSLESQAEEEVAAIRRPEEAAARAESAEAREAKKEELERAGRATHMSATSAKARLVKQVEDRVSAAGTGHMRTARLWREALLRRQAEEESMHGRRLRSEAHEAASTNLGEKGEMLKEELAGIRALTASVAAVQTGELVPRERMPRDY